MRHRIIIQRAARTVNDVGVPSPTWSTHVERWAEIKPLKAIERADTIGSETYVTHEIKIRHLADVTADDRVLFDGRVFEITGVRHPFEDREMTILECSERIEARA